MTQHKLFCHPENEYQQDKVDKTFLLKTYLIIEFPDDPVDSCVLSNMLTQYDPQANRAFAWPAVSAEFTSKYRLNLL